MEAILSDLLLVLAIGLRLLRVVVLDAGKNGAQQLDELCGGLIGQTGQQKGQAK